MTDRRATEMTGMPWPESAPEFAVCNFALGDFINNLPRQLTVEGRIHAETLLAASGAVAGYAAQQALLAEISQDAAALQRHGLQIVQTKAGDEYYFGDALNARLFAQKPEDAHQRLWPLVAGAAVTCGLAPEALPKLEPMFAHVSRVVGSEAEGFPSLAEARPHLPAKELLKLVWPLALGCFNGELSAKVLEPPMAVPHRWRPAIAAIAANTFIRHVRSVLAPDKAVIVVFESAIYASKPKLQLG